MADTTAKKSRIDKDWKTEEVENFWFSLDNSFSSA